MADPRNKLQEMFKDQNRYANFGDMLIRMHVKGFRCHTDTIIEINSPITAFCGLNGTGKSTLLQLASAAYKRSDAAQPQYYIKDFMVVSTLDPTPFRDDATVEYWFWQDNRSHKTLKLSRNAIKKKWRGYKRRLERYVFFAGIGLYLPKIERRDFTIRNASRLTISSSSEVATTIKEWTCKILGQSYDNIFSNIVTHFDNKGTIISVRRADIKYSEPHMGYGEARSQYLINALETLPDKSLVLIEEPETSLHPNAQYQFGRYLADVVIRKYHQILLTTHSEFILEAIPSASRVYLNKTNSGIDTIPGLTAQQAKSLMSDGHIKALHILVEDECAKSVLSEIIRRIDSIFRRSIGIYPAGSEDTIGKAVRTLKSIGLPVVAVRDADTVAQVNENIFSLPGTKPPEKEMFENKAVEEYMKRRYDINLNDFSTNLTGIDHHEWFNRLAEYVDQNEESLMGEIAYIYANNIPELDASTLVNLLKESVRK